MKVSEKSIAGENPMRVKSATFLSGNSRTKWPGVPTGGDTCMRQVLDRIIKAFLSGTQLVTGFPRVTNHVTPHSSRTQRPVSNSQGRKFMRVNACQCSPLAESGTADFVVTRPLLSRSPGVPVDRRSLQDKPANLRRRYPVSHRPEQSGDRALDKIDGSLTGANTPKARMGEVSPGRRDGLRCGYT